MSNTSKKILIAVIACVLVVIGVIVALAVASDGDNTISEDEAKAAALNHAGVTEADAIFTKVGLEEDDGVYRYEIDFRANGYEYDYEIKGSDGTVIESSKEKAKEGDVVEENPKEGAVITDEEEAKKAALAYAGLIKENVTFEKVEMEQNGRYYEVDFTSDGVEYDYRVETMTGKVVESDAEQIDE